MEPEVTFPFAPPVTTSMPREDNSELISMIHRLMQRIDQLETVNSSLPSLLGTPISQPQPQPQSVPLNPSRKSSSRFPTNEIKIRFIGTLFADEALSWFRTLVEAKPHILSSYPLFITEFEAHFNDPRARAQAVRSLRELKKSKSSAVTYSIKFRRLAPDTGFCEIALMDFFVNGLNEDVQDVLAMNDDPQSLEELINKSIKIDQRLFDRRTEKKGATKSIDSRSTKRFNRYASYSDNSSSSSSSLSSPSSPSPMDLDSAQVIKGPLSKAEKTRRRENGLCMYCVVKGHFLSKCPDRKVKYANAYTNILEVAYTTRPCPCPERFPNPGDVAYAACPVLCLKPCPFSKSSTPASSPAPPFTPDATGLIFDEISMTFPNSSSPVKSRALLGSGASLNFISETLVRVKNIPTSALNDSVTVKVANENTFTASRVIRQCLVSGTGFSTPCDFIVAPIGHPVILGLPWFREVNPIIDWARSGSVQ